MLALRLSKACLKVYKVPVLPAIVVYDFYMNVVKMSWAFETY